MNRSLLCLSLLWATCAWSSTALAQASVYRCGPDGNQYSARPCPDGRAIEVADVRSAAQQKQAQNVAQHEQGLARAWRAERLAREQEAPRVAAGIRVAGSPTAGVSAAASAHAHTERKTGKRPAGKTAGAPSRAAIDPHLSYQVRLPAPRVSKSAPKPATARR